MNPKFQASVQSREDVTYVKLSGVIDEDNELGTLADKLGGGGTAVIDVSEIERINSCGVRDWVNWLGKAEKGGAKIVMVECSPAIVAQINLVNNFTGNGVVKSFYAPYFCPNCDLEKVLLVETRDMHGQTPFKSPSCRCDECDGPMDFDDMEESYFAFLGNAKKIVTDSRVDAVINEFTPTDGDRKFRPRSDRHHQPRRQLEGRWRRHGDRNRLQLAAFDPLFAERAQHRLDVGGDAVVDLGNQRVRPHGVHRQPLGRLGAGRAGGAPRHHQPGHAGTIALEHDVAGGGRNSAGGRRDSGLRDLRRDR